jgi:CRT10
VAVFQPYFPLHTLGSRPQLNLVPNLANPEAPGYIDPSRPHSINHLVVGELGSEEILLLATDSGNVAAYHTTAIQDGIDKEPYSFSKDGRSDLVGVRPFFTHWVYESAWGLSIHQNARMLAVSANHPYHEPSRGIDAAITVFAFALTTSDEVTLRNRPQVSPVTTTDDESEWKLWIPKPGSHSGRRPDRSHNWKTRIDAHRHNIPSVSFVNSNEDLEGDYLLSTDIEGITKYWHIWQGIDLQAWDFSRTIGRFAHDHLTSRYMS